MLSRDAALDALSARCRRVDAATLLAAEAERDVQAVLGVCDPERDPRVAFSVGWFHLMRYMVLTSAQGLGELETAFRYFGLMYRSVPDAASNVIRLALRQDGAGTAHDYLADDLASDLYSLYERSGRQFFLEQAIAVFRVASTAALDGDPGRGLYLNNLGVRLAELYELTRDTTTLAEAIQAGRDAVAAACLDHPDRINRLDLLGGGLQRLYLRTGDPGTLAEAVQVRRDMAAAAPEGHPYHTACLNNLGTALLEQYELTGNTQVLREAVQAGRDAVAATPAGADRVSYLSNLAQALLRWYQRTGDTQVLREAVQAGRDTAAATPEGSPNRDNYLNNLCVTLTTLFEATGDIQVLREAVQAGRDTAAVTRHDHPDYGMRLNNLGNALRDLYQSTGDTDVLAETVRVQREAVAATSDEDPYLAGRLHNLSISLRLMSERMGDSGVLAEAVQAGRDAAAASPQDHPDQPMIRNNLGHALHDLYERTGDTGLLAETVQTHREAVAASPQDHPDRATYLNGLGIVLQDLYTRTGDSAALAEAVQAARNAVAASPQDHPDRATYLHNLAGALMATCELTEEIGTLTEAVQVSREAADALPGGHPDRAVYLGTHGNALDAMYRRTHDSQALAELIQIRRDAVAAAPDDHPVQASCLGNLSNSLLYSYMWTDDDPALDEALRTARKAIAALPDGHPSRAIYLNNLGIALRDLSSPRGDQEAGPEARRCFGSAADNSAATPAVRIRGYRGVASLAKGPDEARTGLQAMEAAAGLAGMLVSAGLARPDREHQAGELAGLAGEAASAAIAAHRPERAVELLEQTRGVLMADALDAHGSDQGRLRDHHPGLADQLDQLRIELDTSADPGLAARPDPVTGQASDTAMTVSRQLGARRQAAYTSWRQLTEQIRDLPGFADFHLPQIGQLTRQADEGPVVIITAGAERGDALILTGTPDKPVMAIPLSNLTDQAARDRWRQMLAAQQQRPVPFTEEYDRQQQQIFDVLGWLWDSVTGPVLAALGCTTDIGANAAWPRVWWCPVGVLAFLPLHAAGHHGEGPNPPGRARAVMDRVVSSYTPTVRSLAYARANRPATSPSSAVIIAVPDTPGTPLPGTLAETATIRTVIPSASVLTSPARRTVLDALPGHHIAHFACHGVADQEYPAQSHLILPAGPLTVADIGRLRLSAGLAYLSACETTVTSARLADESVHITGAFHLAGYQHVIGTLWPINDAVAASLADAFYRRLTADGTTPPDISRSAYALHRATRRVRERYRRHPIVWAAYTHTGA